ncbi:MAG: hypothetical protein H8E39_00510 [Alphaproteobacteria bacterium]|nr:hypothetical protein [Alphaproteobacteria bacterium]
MHRPALALVAFSSEAELKWLKLFKPGFRHCFVALESGPQWILYNPLSNRTEVAVLETGDLLRAIKFYRERGLVLVPWKTKIAPLKPAPWAPFTCVEAVKRVLGIQAARVVTPWNLYNFLKK